MDDILNLCIRVDGKTAYFPTYDEAEPMPLQAKPEMEKKFGWNNGKVAFVTEDGYYYVTPFCFDVAEKLREIGYEEAGLYVPFSNGDIPQDDILADKWKNLCDEARKKYDAMRKEEVERERTEKLKEIADKKFINDLPEDVYKLSIRIPAEGLETIWRGSEKDVIRPVDESKLEDCMGTYCGNNGKLSFVTPFYFEISELLRNNGYKEGSLFVPLSNGEDIVNPELSARWKIMCDEARELFNKRQEENDSNYRM